MEAACTRLVDELKQSRQHVSAAVAAGSKKAVELAVKKIKERVGGICGDVRKKLPTDVVFGSFFDGIQAGFNSDLDAGLKACEKRIDAAIDEKAAG